MELQDYEVMKTTWINGRRALPGATVKLTERAARYHLLDGALKPAVKPASKPVSKSGNGATKAAKKDEV